MTLSASQHRLSALVRQIAETGWLKNATTGGDTQRSESNAAERSPGPSQTPRYDKSGTEALTIRRQLIVMAIYPLLVETRSSSVDRFWQAHEKYEWPEAENPVKELAALTRTPEPLFPPEGPGVGGIQLNLNEKSTMGSSPRSQIISLLENLNYLEEFLMPALCESFKKIPWAPLLFSIVTLFNQKAEKGYKCWYLLKTSVLFSSKSTSDGVRREMFLKTLLGHLMHIPTSQRTLHESSVTASFLALLVHQYDRLWVQAVIHPFVCESLLRPLLESSASCMGSAHIQMLEELLTHFRIPTKFAGRTNEGLMFSILDEFICHLITYQQCLEHPSSSSSLQWAVYHQYFVGVLDLLANITGQPASGRYMSFVLLLWFPTSLKAHVLAGRGAFRLVDLLLKLRFRPEIARRIQSTVLTLQLNVLRFLRGKHGRCVLPAVEVDRDCSCAPPVLELFGLNRIFPDEQFLVDLFRKNLYLPQMQLQCLSFRDYLLRNFLLFKCEAAQQLWSMVVEYPENLHILSRCDGLSGGTRVQVQSTRAKPLSWMDQHSKASSSSSDTQSVRFVLLLRVQKDGTVDRLCGASVLSSSNSSNVTRQTNLELESAYRAAEPFTHLFVINPMSSAYTSVMEVLFLFLRHAISDKETILPVWLVTLLTGHAHPERISRISRGLDGVFQPLRSERLAAIDFALLHSTRNLGELLQALKAIDLQFSITLTEDYQSQVLLTIPNIPQDICLRFSPPHNYQSQSLYPVQRTAVLSALLCPVTLIVGPPGTGKTFTTTMITQLLYNNLCRNISQPAHQILLVAHSNLAVDQLLRDLYSALRKQGCAETFPFVRLGRQSCDPLANRYTIDGHYDYWRQKILHVCERYGADTSTALGKVCVQVGAMADAQQYAEASILFRDFHQRSVRPLEFLFAEACSVSASEASRMFDRVGIPKNARQPAALRALLTDLEPIAQFLDWLACSHRDTRDRLLKHAAVIVVTCSGAAVYQTALRRLNIRTVVLEEAGKILETEILATFFPSTERLVLIGDDKQLSSVIKHTELRENSNFDQSLFKRLRRLGVPPIVLNQQGRAKPEICDLYRWRYTGISDLPSTKLLPFIDPLFDTVQFVHVSGRTDREVNHTEAVLIAYFATYLVWRKVDTSRITVLTPYRQQAKHLQALFRSSPRLAPVAVCTTDEFQGKQNDIILVSLVLAGEAPSPHLRDERRLCVLTSRARCAFFLFGRRTTFESCREWEAILEAIRRAGPPSNSISDVNRLRVRVLDAPEPSTTSANLDTVTGSSSTATSSSVESDPSASSSSSIVIRTLHDWDRVLPADVLDEIAAACGLVDRKEQKSQSHHGKYKKSTSSDRSHLDEDPILLMERLKI